MPASLAFAIIRILGAGLRGSKSEVSLYSSGTKVSFNGSERSLFMSMVSDVCKFLSSLWLLGS